MWWVNGRTELVSNEAASCAFNNLRPESDCVWRWVVVQYQAIYVYDQRIFKFWCLAYGDIWSLDLIQTSFNVAEDRAVRHHERLYASGFLHCRCSHHGPHSPWLRWAPFGSKWGLQKPRPLCSSMKAEYAAICLTSSTCKPRHPQIYTVHMINYFCQSSDAYQSAARSFVNILANQSH